MPCNPLRTILLIFWLMWSVPAALFAASGPTPGATSAETGRFSGRVQNSATGAYLEGALVTLESTQYSTFTGRDGAFYFPALPPGEYRVSASYTGLDTQTVSVAIPTGGNLTREFALTSKAYAMDAFTVAGEREGNALAITQQRNAPNVKNVLSSDAFGNIADQNIGNLLMRLPGVTEEMSEGEVGSVSVRGISSSMNAVTVDGTRGANGATGTMNRAFQVDRLPADFVEQIEVTKALTPDMDGDSIGGAINLRTKSPLDRKGRSISYMGGASWNLDRGTLRPIASFNYSNVFGAEQKLGVLFTSSFNRTHKPRDSVYKNWQVTTNTSAPAYFYMSNLGEDRLTHKRIGVGLRVDYKLSPTHRIFLNTMYADYTDTLDRRHFVMTPTAAQIRPGWTDTVTETINHPLSLSQNHRVRAVESVNFVFGGEKRFASGLIDYGANYSLSNGTEDRVIPTMQVSGVGFRFDRSKSIEYPTMTQISGPAYTDRSAHTNTLFNLQDFDDKDVIKAFHVNWRKTFATAAPAGLKMGIRYRGQDRNRDQSRPVYIYAGPDGIVGVNPATRLNDDNIAQFADASYTYRSARGRYDPVPVVDPEAMRRHLTANPNQFTLNVLNTTRDDLQFDGKISEEVTAGYIMGDLHIGPIDIMGGVRLEQTNVSSRGVRQEITPAERARRAAWVGTVTSEELRRRTIAEWSNLREDKGEYRNVLPSLHFKYSPLRDVVTRLSYSTGLGRPNFSNLLLVTNVSNENMTIRAANPDLRPQTAQNFDFTLEYYFEPAGHLSAGVFLKEIRDFIFASRGETVGAGPNNGFDGQYEGYISTMDTNGGFARVRGFELSYSQRFTFLPGLWKGLGFMANYTRMDTRGEYTATGGVVTKGELALFQPESFNTGLSYAHRGLDVQIKAIYRGEMLNTYNANAASRLYNYSRTNIDLNLKYSWKPWMTFFVDVINLFDGSSADAFVYVPDRNRYTMVYTPAIKAGISGRF
ncbi:MAG: hypothetical protein RIQ93_30 [Verrucomicrobiota bacterium]|jgi:TonB-dependent receptor